MANRETVETVTDYFGGSKITANGGCSHESKRHLLLGRKAMTNLHSILRSRDITLSTKVCLVKATVFPVVMCGCAAAKSLQSRPTPCEPIDSSPPGSSVPGILQARTLKCVAISFSSAWEWKMKVKSLSCDPMDYSLPGSSVRGIFQARVLEWVAISFSHMDVRACI